jgi:hypothetical protein
MKNKNQNNVDLVRNLILFPIQSLAYLCLSEKVMETIPYCSMKRSAFSKKEGLPSISSRASDMGLPTTKDFTGLRPLPEKSFNSHRLRNWNNRSENIPSRTNLLQNRHLELKAHS